ncbi:sulfotransferase family protein [Parahaliea aestuarii]|uniref:Sulfotransferase family protein n=1 Tax=Parahaliea aestuarii TaxID=1852021 RepID=A0A5C8ZNK8_9GAMM|nr:sulfotransferase family protein [Parahaliea aestuarii]TXS90058.1 sulfotransferase family protein [Parahaliea aestuarii]
MNQAVRTMPEAGQAADAGPARLVAILGMHRSGTSCLTGSLQGAGLFLGECHTWNPYNRKGNRENQAFVDLHDTILQDNGGSWDSPPAHPVWGPEHQASARSLLAEHAGAGILGFKDPRALLLFEGWKTIFPHIEMVGIFRHPEAVARSLHHRSEMPRQKALALWYHYNRALLFQYRQHRFPVLCFDRDPEIFQQEATELAKWLRLPDQPKASDFYEESLKQFSEVHTAGLPWRVRWLYWQLQRVSRRGLSGC